tara:strand:- start:2418 stop:2651 length:234 start_codon:yes stop_codon:yes gene_type:complete
MQVFKFHKQTWPGMAYREGLVLQVVLELEDGDPLPDFKSQGERVADLLLGALPGETVIALRDRLSEHIQTILPGGEQ